MNFNKTLKINMSKLAHKAGKAAPTVGTTVGVAGIAATAFLASKATLKAVDVMEEHREMVGSLDRMYEMHKNVTKDDISEMRKNAETEEDVKYLSVLEDFDPDGYAKAHFGTWVITGTRLAKVYAPAILTGIASATLIVLSHRAMTNRVSALAAAYSTLQTAFNEYRGYIKDKVGEDVDEAALKNNAERYREHKMMPNESDFDGRFERVFGEGRTRAWSRNPQDNLRFLSSQQNYFNDMLRARGYVFLNEVYEALGFQTVPAGQMVGWMYTGDEGSVGFVDFGIFDTEDVAARLSTEPEDWFLLKFNVDGVIYNQI